VFAPPFILLDLYFPGHLSTNRYPSVDIRVHATLSPHAGKSVFPVKSIGYVVYKRENISFNILLVKGFCGGKKQNFRQL
jgi:hypothetical protein